MVGIKLTQLAPNEPAKRTVPRTKYHVDTGAPYQVDEAVWEETLANGYIMTDKRPDYDYGAYVKSLGLEMQGRTVGLLIEGGEWARGGNEINLALPSIPADIASRVYDLLIKAGFPVAQSDIKVYAVLDVSY